MDDRIVKYVIKKIGVNFFHYSFKSQFRQMLHRLRNINRVYLLMIFFQLFSFNSCFELVVIWFFFCEYVYKLLHFTVSYLNVNFNQVSFILFQFRIVFDSPLATKRTDMSIVPKSAFESVNFFIRVYSQFQGGTILSSFILLGTFVFRSLNESKKLLQTNQ